ncbi:Cubilin-like 9, partial [Homarus americanus]
TTTTTINTTTGPGCRLREVDRLYLWTSSGFPHQNYPDNFKCTVIGRSAVIKFLTFKLQPGCRDNVSLTLPYSRVETFCGERSGEYLLPNFNFRSTFKTDSEINNVGFNISVKGTKSSCHKRLQLRNSTTRSNISIRPKGEERRLYQCEWWIEAPVGKRIQVTRLRTFIASTPNCIKDYLVLNGEGMKNYPASSSLIFCERKVTLQPIITKDNLLYVVYHGWTPDSSGFVLRYKVV